MIFNNNNLIEGSDKLAALKIALQRNKNNINRRSFLSLLGLKDHQIKIFQDDNDCVNVFKDRRVGATELGIIIALFKYNYSDIIVKTINRGKEIRNKIEAYKDFMVNYLKLEEPSVNVVALDYNNPVEKIKQIYPKNYTGKDSTDAIVKDPEVVIIDEVYYDEETYFQLICNNYRYNNLSQVYFIYSLLNEPANTSVYCVGREEKADQSWDSIKIMKMQ